MKKKRPWDQSYSGKVRRKTPPQRGRISLEGHFTKHGDVYMEPPQKAKPARRVFVTLELETDTPLALLRKADWWSAAGWPFKRVLQASANVARHEK